MGASVYSHCWALWQIFSQGLCFWHRASVFGFVLLVILLLEVKLLTRAKVLWHCKFSYTLAKTQNPIYSQTLGFVRQLFSIFRNVLYGSCIVLNELWHLSYGESWECDSNCPTAYLQHWHANITTTAFSVKVSFGKSLSLQNACNFV